jgi:hypothetical protein
MTAFQRTMIGIGLVIGLYWFCTQHHTNMQVVYPDDCVFVIDHIFSPAVQLEIKNFIDQAYKKNKTPFGLLPKIESHFPAVKSVIIDMVNPDSLHFTIQSYHPIFMINHEHVVCQQGKMFPISIFAQDQLKKLENISFDGVPTPKNVDRLITFYTSLQDPILQDFSVRWIDKHAIWLDQKEHKSLGKDLSLLVGYQTIPNRNDVRECRNIREQISDKPCKDKRGKSCKHNITWVCDLRFDRQIVVFSTNKGV